MNDKNEILSIAFPTMLHLIEKDTQINPYFNLEIENNVRFIFFVLFMLNS